MTNAGPLPGGGAMEQLVESKKKAGKNKTEGEQQGGRKQEQGSMASRGSVSRQEEEKLMKKIALFLQKSTKKFASSPIFYIF